MSKRKRIAYLFFLMGLVFAMISIPYSAAMNRIFLERKANIDVADDSNGAISLIGFHNKAYEMNGKYKNYGTITNNTRQILQLTVTIKPNYQIYHLLTRCGVMIGSKECEFRYNSSSAKQIILIMNPKDSFEAKAYLSGNIFYALDIEFQFSATDSTGSFTIEMKNTSSAPRCISLY